APHRRSLLDVRVRLARRRAGSRQFPLQTLSLPEPAQPHALLQSRRRRPAVPGAPRARRGAPNRDLSTSRADHRRRRPRHPRLAHRVGAVLPSVWAERRGERSGCRVLAAAQAVARPPPMMKRGGGITLEIRSLQTKFLIGSLLVLVLIMTGFIAVVERR